MVPFIPLAPIIVPNHFRHRPYGDHGYYQHGLEDFYAVSGGYMTSAAVAFPYHYRQVYNGRLIPNTGDPSVYSQKPEREAPKQIEQVPQVVERIIEKTIIKEVYVPQKPPEKEKEMSLTSFSSILTIMIICIVTVKFIIPRLTTKYIIWKFVGLFWKPAKKKAADVKAEWNAANNGA